MSMRFTGPRALLALALATLAGTAITAVAQPGRPRGPAVNGTISSLQGARLTIAGPTGDKVTVSLDAKARIVDQEPASLADVKAGRFIGTTAVQEADGQLHAREIHVFPESMRGAGEGHYPMGAPDTTMTNGNLESVNGNVEQSALGGAKIDTRPGLVLRVDYQGGQSVILVPPDVTVTKMSVGTRALLKRGAHVTVLAQRTAGGGLSAGTVIVHGGPARHATD